jgi:Ca-activated chloride channel family protein
MKRFLRCLVLIQIVCLGSTCVGQGVLISSSIHPIPLPRPIVPPLPITMSYKIKELDMQARITDQVARVQVSQTFVNTGSATMEVSFCFPLPYDGAIDQMTLLVDGKEYPAKLLPAKEARSIYEGYVRRNQDPALLEWIGTGMFQTSVFPVPVGAERKVSLSFTQLLRKSDRLTDFLYPLSTAKFTSQPIETLKLTASIQCQSKIKSVYSPSHAMQIQRPDDHQAVVSIEAKNAIPGNDFRLFFDTADSELGASVVSYRPKSTEDGYFLLLASPEVKRTNNSIPPQTILFVIDRSGSMSGKKLEQSKEALKFVLNNLREGDLFNIIVYDNTVESFKPELQRFDEATRKSALGYVEGIYAGGSTNISDALTRALDMIQSDDRPSYIVFLTDGLPTAGQTNEMAIGELVRKRNAYRTRLISFGVGYDVNSRLLDRLSRDNHGHNELVRPNEDIEQQVSRLYRRISSPVMTDVSLKIQVEGIATEVVDSVNRLYPKQMYDLFEGDQVVVVGRYRVPGQSQVSISGKIGDQSARFDFSANLAAESSDQTFGFVEKLWAVRRVGEIIDELDLNGPNKELTEELVALATKHGLLTPYTSFLADETTSIRELSNVSGNAIRAGVQLRELEAAGGQVAFEQRAAKNSMRNTAQSTANDGFYYQVTDSPVPGIASAANASLPQVFQSVPDSSAAASSGAQSAVQIVGNQTLYKRGKIWVAENATDIDIDQNADRIQVVARFSEQYFQLISDNTPSENALMATQRDGEELLVLLRGKHYRIQ